MMKDLYIGSGLVVFLYGGSAHATSFGRMGHANIASMDNKLAICLPNNTKKTFQSVG